MFRLSVFTVLVASILIERAVAFLGKTHRVSNDGSMVRRTSTTSLTATLKHELVVWDCDGVLVDSEALLKQGEVEALARAGIELSVDDCVRLFSGVSVDEAANNFLKDRGSPLPPDFFKEQIAGSMQLFRDRLVPLMTDTVLSLHHQGYRQCVASGSPLDRVTLCLELAKIDKVFNSKTVFTRELVKRGKPAPDLFLYAAEKMDVHPSKCIVVEDASSGIEAALAANMKVIGYLGGGHAQKSWYRAKIESYNIPLAYSKEEVLAMINK